MWNSLLPALYPISVHPLSTLSIFPSLSHPASYPASNQPPIHLPIHPHLGPCPACHPFSIHPPKGQCPKPSLHFATPPSALFSFLSFIGPATHTCLELSLSAPCSPPCVPGPVPAASTPLPPGGRLSAHHRASPSQGPRGRCWSIISSGPASQSSFSVVEGAVPP